MAAEQLADLDEATLQAMYLAVQGAARGKKYQITQFGPLDRYTPRELAEKKRAYKALWKLENMLAANINQTRARGSSRGQEAHRGK